MDKILELNDTVPIGRFKDTPIEEVLKNKEDRIKFRNTVKTFDLKLSNEVKSKLVEE